jgi:hypothetical protein
MNVEANSAKHDDDDYYYYYYFMIAVDMKLTVSAECGSCHPLLEMLNHL